MGPIERIPQLPFVQTLQVSYVFTAENVHTSFLRLNLVLFASVCFLINLPWIFTNLQF